MLSTKHQISNPLDVISLCNCGQFEVQEQMLNDRFHLKNGKLLAYAVTGSWKG